MAFAHRHDDIELNVADGDLVYLLNGTRTRVPAGRVGVFWAAGPHQLMDVATGTRVTWLTIPLTDFLGWGLPPGFVSALLQGELLIPDCVPFEAGARFQEWERDLGSESDFLVRAARLEAQAFLLRLSLAREAGTAQLSTAAGAMDSVAVMAGFIATRFSDPIGVAEVAQSAHLHPSYAMAIFKRVAGVTMGRYLTQCRVAEAQRLLLTSGTPVSDIALASGFGSLSQFYERFRASSGTTPLAYRRRHSARVGPPRAESRHMVTLS